MPFSHRGRVLSTVGGVFRLGNVVGPLVAAGVIGGDPRWDLLGVGAILGVVIIAVDSLRDDVVRVLKRSGSENCRRPRPGSCGRFSSSGSPAQTAIA